MPEVPAVRAAEQPLIDAYRTAWDRVVAQQNALVADPMQARKRARLAEMRAVIEDTMEELQGASSRWIAEHLPQVYTAGGTAGAGAMGTSEFLWTAISQEAVEELAGGMFKELLDATTHVNTSTKTLIREIAQSEALQKAIEGRTAQQAGQEMARLISKKGISAVVYKNGAKHGLAEYGEMVARTTTAKAYNYGVLNGAAQKGCEFWECFDGPDCGWSAHESGEQAAGKIVTRDEALEFPISHPNCRRAFGARPDLTQVAQVGEGKGSVSAEQIAAQRAQDVARQERQARRSLRNRATAERRAGRDPASRVEKRAARMQEWAAERASEPSLPVEAPARIWSADPNQAHRDQYAYLTNLRTQSEATLSKEGKDALEYYQGSGFRVMNDQLRLGQRGLDAERIDGQIEDLVTATTSTATSERLTVFRGANMEADFEVGSIIEDSGFMSTTLQERFAEEWVVGGYHPVVFEIDAPKDSLFGLPEVSPDEMELLFPPGARMQIISAEPETIIWKRGGFEKETTATRVKVRLLQ